MEKLEKLRMLLENVTDSYSDFVIGGLREAKDDEKYADMIFEAMFKEVDDYFGV